METAALHPSPSSKEPADSHATKRVSIQNLLNSDTSTSLDGFTFAVHTLTTVSQAYTNQQQQTFQETITNNDGDNNKNNGNYLEEDSDSNGHKKKRAKSNLMLEMCSELWMKHYTRLREYHKLYGNTNVTRTKPEWKTLGNWVAEQRRKMKNGKLSQHQLELLNELGKKLFTQRLTNQVSNGIDINSLNPRKTLLQTTTTIIALRKPNKNSSTLLSVSEKVYTDAWQVAKYQRSHLNSVLITISGVLNWNLHMKLLIQHRWRSSKLNVSVRNRLDK